MLTISWTDQNITGDGSGDLTSDVVEHTLQFDAVTKEGHEFAAEMTQHTVESGAAISDHKRPKPKRLTIEAMVTNTPIALPPPSGHTQVDPISGAERKTEAGVVVLQFDGFFDRKQQVFDALLDLLEAPTLLTISTSVNVYDQMSIVNVTVPRESADGSKISFGIEAVEVITARTDVIDIPQPREPRGRPAADAGAQEPQTAEAQVREALGGFAGVASGDQSIAAWLTGEGRST